MRLDAEDVETKVASTVARVVGVAGGGAIKDNENGGSDETVVGSRLSEVDTKGGSCDVVLGVGEGGDGCGGGSGADVEADRGSVGTVVEDDGGSTATLS